MARKKNNKPCSINDCAGLFWSRDLCQPHYNRLMKYGDPLWVKPPPPVKIVKDCTVDDCNKPQYLKKWCRPHYTKWQKYGDPLWVYVKKTCEIEDCQGPRDRGGKCNMHFSEMLRARSRRPNFNVKHFYEEGRYQEFIEAVRDTICEIDENGCWIWKRGGQQGYGRLSIFDQDHQAHRAMFQASQGGIDLGIDQVHHTCANRGCVNPEHLQLVSAKENMAEMLERLYYKRRITELEANTVLLEQQVEDITIDFEQQIALLQKELDEIREAG